VSVYLEIYGASQRISNVKLDLDSSSKLTIQLQGRSCIIFSFCLVSRETGAANKYVSEWNL